MFYNMFFILLFSTLLRGEIKLLQIKWLNFCRIAFVICEIMLTHHSMVKIIENCNLFSLFFVFE